jgi:hypothetical protein
VKVEELDAEARTRAAASILRRHGVETIEVRTCSHGFTAEGRLQIGRSHKVLEAHGYPDRLRAVEALADMAATEAPKRKRRR